MNILAINAETNPPPAAVLIPYRQYYMDFITNIG